MTTKIFNSSALGQVLRDARKQAGLTQEQAAQIIGVARTSIVAVEQGIRQVHVRELVGLAQCYGVDPAELLAQAEKHANDDTLTLLLIEMSPAQKQVISRLLHTEPCISTQQAVKMMACGMPLSGVEDVACALLHLLIDQESGAVWREVIQDNE